MIEVSEKRVIKPKVKYFPYDSLDGKVKRFPLIVKLKPKVENQSKWEVYLGKFKKLMSKLRKELKLEIKDLLHSASLENSTHTQFPHLEIVDDDNLVDIDSVYCSRCGSNEDTEDNDILFCDHEHCNRVYHLKCLDCYSGAKESLDDPDETWFCEQCEFFDNCYADIKKYVYYENLEKEEMIEKAIASECNIEVQISTLDDVFPEVNGLKYTESTGLGRNSPVRTAIAFSDDSDITPSISAADSAYSEDVVNTAEMSTSNTTALPVLGAMIGAQVCRNINGKLLPGVITQYCPASSTGSLLLSHRLFNSAEVIADTKDYWVVEFENRKSSKAVKVDDVSTEGRLLERIGQKCREPEEKLKIRWRDEEVRKGLELFVTYEEVQRRRYEMESGVTVNTEMVPRSKRSCTLDTGDGGEFGHKRPKRSIAIVNYSSFSTNDDEHSDEGNEDVYSDASGYDDL